MAYHVAQGPGHAVLAGQAEARKGGGEHRIVGGEREAASDVSITDGVQHARAISFFEVADGRVQSVVEYWPEPYDAPANRAHLVERMD